MPLQTSQRSSQSGRAWRRAGAGLAAAAVAAVGAVLAAPSPASAHVTLDADQAVPGGNARVVFRVPTEADSPTVGLEVHLLPAGAPPIASVLTMPVPGWSVEVGYEDLDEPVPGAHGEAITTAVSTITWTADDESAGIQPGEFGEFPVEIGPLPDVDELYFPTFQTYAGVDEPVEWLEPPDPDGGEPAEPAPLLRLASPEDASDAGVPFEELDDGGQDAGEADGADPGTAADDSGDGGAGSAGVWLGLAGLVAGLGGLALGGIAFVRTRG